MSATNASESELRTVDEVAHELRVHRTTVHRAIARGELDVVRLGRVVRIPVASLERLTRPRVVA